MQLFILDREPSVAVQYLSDCHVCKMCLETAQILSSVMFNKGITVDETLPKPYNPKHPVIQAIQSPEQINWVFCYYFSLHHEFYMRFHKPHAYNILKYTYADALYDIKRNISCEGLARDFKDFCTDKSDIVEAHRDYYRYKKSIIKNWKYTYREEPEWLL